MKIKKGAVILVIPVLAGILAGYFLLKEKKDPDMILTSGNIEVTDVSLSFKNSRACGPVPEGRGRSREKGRGVGPHGGCGSEGGSESCQN